MGIKYILLRLFILASLFVLQQGAKAADESYIQTLSGKIKKGDSCVVIDDKFLNLPLNKWNMIQHLSVNNIISFELRFDTSIYFHNKPFTCTLNVSVKYFTSRDQQTPEEINNIDLVVKYDTAKGKYYPAVAQHKFKNAFKVVVVVNSIQSPEWGETIPSVFRLKNQILVQRRYPFNPHAGAPAHAFRLSKLKMLPAFLLTGLFGFIDVDKTNDQAIISWDPDDFDDESTGFSNPAEYDVEWTYIDRFSKEGNDIFSLYGDGTTIPVSKAEEWMRNNSTRVTVALPPYIINLPYPEGYILVRVRGVGYTQDEVRVLGDWQYEENDEDELHYALCVPLDTDFQPDLNWQYAASFAEEGKRRELITYFDATMRNRQIVTLSNSDQTLVTGGTTERQETAIVQETIYDDMGRPVMHVLPAPTDNKSIRYYPAFNKNGTGQAYSHKDINLAGTNSCEIGGAPMSTISGASRYFSPQNPFQNDNDQYYFTKYVPDAEQYPYGLVEFTSDNTRRIRRKGGVGKAFQPGANFSPGPEHTTRYFYSKPSPKELYRIFGSEVGNASHYLKNLVVDPNGQISVSYINAYGKTVATALAGKTLNNLETLPGAGELEAKRRFNQELIGNRDFRRDAGQLMTQATATFTAAVSGNYVIHYTVNPAALVTYHEPAHTVQFCNNCYYEIVVEVRDDCGNPIASTTSTPFSGNDVTCHSDPPVVTSSLPMNIARIGEYSVTYTLRLTDDVIKFHEDYYIENNIDLFTLKKFFVDELEKLDLLSCYDECQSCKTLGSEAEFRENIRKLVEGNPGFEGMEWSEDPGDPVNTWIHDTWQELNNNCSQLSCDATGACEDYLAQMKMDVLPGGQYAPYTYDEQSGQYTYTERTINVLQYYQDASFPDLTFNMENGASVQRKALSESDLIREYINHPEWADDFVKKHIEYCSYEWCKDQSYSPLNKNNEASYNFDKTLRLVIETGTDAVSRNFYNRNDMFAIMDYDPFFSVGGRGAALATQMELDLSNLSGVLDMKMRDPVNGNLLPVKNIFQLIDWMLYCKPTDPAATTAQIAGSWTNCTIDASCRSVTREWELYRNYYLKLKSKYVRYVKNQVNPTCTDCFIGDDVLIAGTCVEPGPLSDYSVAMSGIAGPGFPLPKYYLRYKNGTAAFKGEYIVRINVTRPAPCIDSPEPSVIIEVRTKKGQLQVDNIYSCLCANNPNDCLNYTFEILSVKCVNDNAIPECAPLPPVGPCPPMNQFTLSQVQLLRNGQNNFMVFPPFDANGQPNPPIFFDDGTLFQIDDWLKNGSLIWNWFFSERATYIHNGGPVTRPVNIRVRKIRDGNGGGNPWMEEFFWLTINPGEDRRVIGINQSAYATTTGSAHWVEFSVVEVQCPPYYQPPTSTCTGDPRYQYYTTKNRVFNDYVDEQSRIVCQAGNTSPPPTEQDNLARARAAAIEDLKVMRKDWIERLKKVRAAEAPAFNAVTDLMIDDLVDALYKVSEQWITIAPADNIRPASTLPIGELSSRDHNSFTAAFAQIIGFSLMQQGFSHELLDNPYPHDKTPVLVNPVSGEINTTICANLAALRTRFSNSGFTGTFHDYLKAELDEDFVLTETELIDLEARCTTGCRYTETPIVLPAAFITPVPANADHPFVNCSRIAALRAGFNATYPTLIPQSKLYALLFANSLNHSLGYSLPYHAYEEFTAACNNNPAAVLYNKPASRLFLPDEFACTANMLRSAYERAGQEYERYIIVERKKFRNAYISTCLANKASANLEGEVFEYHYTLYYYDQAGNLVKTIPPEGVRLLSDEEIDIVDKNRDFDPSTCLATGTPTTENKAATFTAFSTAVENTSGKSLELWINNTGTSPDRHIRFITPDNKYMVQAAIHDGKLWAELYTLEREGNEVVGISLTNQAVADASAITLQPWSHLVIQSLDFAGATWDVYLDGRLLTLLPTADEPPYPFAWEIGAGSILPSEETSQLKHLRVYNTVISAGQVLNNYNNACLAPVGELQNIGDPLLVWGRFNIPTLCNTAGTTTTPNRGSLLVTSNRDFRSKTFEHIRNSFTVELWVNPQETHEIDVESQTGAAGTDGQKWAIYPTYGGTAASGRAFMGISVGTNGVTVYEHAEAYLAPLLVWQGAVNGWTHVAVVYTNKTPTLYINGVLAKPGLTSTKDVVSPSYNFGGGAFGFMPGGLDEARIWSVARTAQQIADNYQQGIPSSTSDLAGYWPMSPADGMQLEDYSCNNNPFTLNEGQQWLTTGAPVTDQVQVEYAEHFLVPQHGLATMYAYNSLNQVIKQSEPDAGISEFFYDRLGRLVASQNAEQLTSSVGDANNRFSYTKYDPLGRAFETGEKTGGSFMSENLARDNDLLNSWFSSGADRQITKTIYDASPVFAPGILSNLRKRVAASVLRETAAGPIEQATFYSYDISGNVKTLYQEIRKLKEIEPVNGIKRLDYEYDLISTKINKVKYQEGKGDQFYYSYQYDADNRVIAARTSRDAQTWNTEAVYRYYLHGPLARAELGNNRVQGLDYAYTLQGWLKGINGIELDANKDMSQDGKQGSTNFPFVGRDAIALSLGYYLGDYKPIGGTAAEAFALPYIPQIGLPVEGGNPVYPSETGTPLFNGNITHTTIALSKIDNGSTKGYTYRYDQLNRLKQMRMHNIIGGTGVWANSSIIQDYREDIGYDANGNILSYLRNGNNSLGLPMDNLEYKYNRDDDGRLMNNQLNHVIDNVTSKNYDIDIATGQLANNYLYDKIGNLIADEQENLDMIRWNVYGKISKLHRYDYTPGTPEVPDGHGSTVDVTYKYDASGNRVVKDVVKETLSNIVVPDKYITTFYVRDAMGNIIAVYTRNIDENEIALPPATRLIWEEQHLYGSSRLGIWKPNIEMTSAVEPPVNGQQHFNIGQRTYELSNHLGNVLATISDDRVAFNLDINQQVDYYEPVVLTATDYYPFGMVMQGREYAVGNSYRYGFNGKEKDVDAVIQYDYGFRIYDPRIGRFKSVDPLTKSFPWYTPYQFAGNKPIVAIDLDGLEEKVATLKYTAPDGSVLKLPKDAIVELSTGIMANHRVVQTVGEEIIFPYNFADFFPNGTVGNFTYKGINYAGAYDDKKFLGYFAEACNCYWGGAEVWFPDYKPLFNHDEEGLINIPDPSGGVIADAFQIADYIETASGIAGGVKVITKASIPLLIKAIKNFRDDLTKAGKSILKDKADHILQDKHLWDDVVKGTGNKFDEVQKVIAEVAEKGQVIIDKGSNGRFGSIVKRVNGKWVEVRFGKTPDGGYRINDGWVADQIRSAELDKIFGAAKDSAAPGFNHF